MNKEYKTKETKGLKGPKLQVVDRMSLPPMGRGHGTEALILSMPFWNDLVSKLREGLTPSEAVEIDLSDPATTPNGKTIPTKRFAARVRYQFTKMGFDKKYSLLVPGKSTSMYVVDNETAAMVG